MTESPIPELQGLLACVSLPWAYRPCEYDDWGFIRGPEKIGDLIGPYRPVVCNSRQSDVTEEQMAEHRTAKTDPYEPVGRLVVAAVNALPQLLAGLAAKDAEIASLTEALTPSGDTKGAYHGEFSIKRVIGDPDRAGVSPTETIPVPWDTVKEIMAAISARAARALHQNPEAENNHA